MQEPSWWRPGVGILGLGVLAGLSQGFISDDEWWIVGLITIASGLMLLPAVWRASHRAIEEVLADHFLVLAVAFIAYSVVGALMIPFGPRDQVDYLLSFYLVDASLGMRVTAVNCVGLGLALVSGSVVSVQPVSRWARTAVRFGRSIPQQRVVAGFLLIGGASSLLVWEFDMDPRPDDVIPGILRMASQLLLVAIVVAAAHRGRWSRALFPLAIVLTMICALVGLLMLNKSGVLLPIVALLAGLAWRLGVRRVIIPGLAALLAVYVLIGDQVSTGRSVYGVRDRVVISERLDFISEEVLGSNPKTEGSSAWTRFCYVASQGAAIAFYDSGHGGDEYSLLGWSFVPRFLFPEKPIMTGGAPDFYTRVTGQEGTSVGQGVFANGYYNLGWSGTLLAGIAVGWMLAWTSAFAFEVYRARALLWLPFAVLGSFMAFRIDGSFLTDYWSPFVLFALAVFAGVALSPPLRSADRVR